MEGSTRQKRQERTSLSLILMPSKGLSMPPLVCEPAIMSTERTFLFRLLKRWHLSAVERAAIVAQLVNDSTLAVGCFPMHCVFYIGNL